MKRVPEVERRLGPAGRAAEHHAPARTQREQRDLEQRRADVVEDHVRARATGRGARRGDDVVAPVVDGDVGAELDRTLQFLVGARGGDHRRAERAAIWIAATLTPLPAAWMTIVSPACSRPVPTSAF